MSQRDDVQRTVFRALENLNAELPQGSKVPISVETPLLGERAPLDSLSLVSVIVDVETGLADQFGYAVSLTDDRALSQEVSPFTNVGALVSYIMILLNERV